MELMQGIHFGQLGYMLNLLSSYILQVTEFPREAHGLSDPHRDFAAIPGNPANPDLLTGSK
jgi:hypothetical protein